MKIKSTSSKNKFIIPAIALLVLAAISVGLLYYYKVGPFASKGAGQDAVNYKKPTKEQVDAGTSAKKDFESRTTEASHERQAANGEQPASQAGQVSTIISSANMNGATLGVRTILQTIDSSGSCKLTLSKTGEQSLVKTAGTQTMGSYSSCQGFDIDTTSLAKGDWQLQLTYTGSAGQTGSASKVVTIQ